MFHDRALTVQLFCQSKLFNITSANSVDHTFHVLMRSGDVVMIKLGGTQDGPKCQWDTDVSGLLVRKHQPLPTNLVGYYAPHVPGACKRNKYGRWRCSRSVNALGAFAHHLTSATPSSPPSTRRLPAIPFTHPPFTSCFTRFPWESKSVDSLCFAKSPSSGVGALPS